MVQEVACLILQGRHLFLEPAALDHLLSDVVMGYVFDCHSVKLSAIL